VLRYSAVIIAALLLAPQLPAWTPPERVDRRPDGYHASLPAVAVDPSGGVHAVWTETPASGFQDKIMYAQKLGDTWSVPVFISRDSGDIRDPRIISDTAGQLIVVWSEEGAARIRYVRQLGDTWSVPKLAFVQHGVVPRLALDARGQIHMLFGELGGAGDVWHSRYMLVADSWTTPVVAAAGVGVLGWHDVVADRQGRLHAAWMDYGTYGIGYSSYDGVHWSDPVALPDPSPSSQSCDPNLAVDSLGLPHVVWQERWGRYYEYYSRFTGDSWTTPYRLYEQDGGMPVVEPDDRGHMLVVWGWDNGVRYVVRTDSGWTEPMLVTGLPAFPFQMIRGRTRLHLVWGGVPWTIGYSEHSSQGACEEEAVLDRPGAVRVTPVRTRLRVSLTLAHSGRVSIRVLDAGGRTVGETAVAVRQPGMHEFDVGDSLPNGVYFCQVSAGGTLQTFKTVLIR
jgi:hypothetical protein